MERVAVLGGAKWRDETSVKLFIKELAAGTVVLVDEDPFVVQATALRQCRCSHLVGVVHRLPGGPRKNAVEIRRQLDEVLLGSATRVVVFGDIAADREHTLRAFEANGLDVRRVR